MSLYGDDPDDLGVGCPCGGIVKFQSDPIDTVKNPAYGQRRCTIKSGDGGKDLVG